MSNKFLTYLTFFKIHEFIRHKIKIKDLLDTKFNFMFNGHINFLKVNLLDTK